LNLVARTKSKDKTIQKAATDELSARFPFVKEEAGKWKIKGKAELCDTVQVDMELREIKRDEVIGLKDPCDSSKFEEVKRPLESK
jgi:hypothetical protein